MRKMLMMLLIAAFAIQAHAITEQDVKDLMTGPSGTTVTDDVRYKEPNAVMICATHTTYTRLGQGILIQYVSNQSSGTACSMIFVSLDAFGSYVRGTRL